LSALEPTLVEEDPMEWKIRKGADEYPCPDIPTLKLWAAEGRILKEDYVFNPILGQWLYARDVAEIQANFVEIKKQSQAQDLKKVAMALGILGVVFLVLSPPFGGLLILAAVICAVIHHVKAGTVI
jgi:hypothetical protein